MVQGSSSKDTWRLAENSVDLIVGGQIFKISFVQAGGKRIDSHGYRRVRRMMLAIVFPVKYVVGIASRDMPSIAGLGVGQGNQQTRINGVRGAGIVERFSISRQWRPLQEMI